MNTASSVAITLPPDPALRTTSFPRTFGYQDKWALSDYINDSFASCQQRDPVRRGTWAS
ncbi:TPA: hypothetical protein ACRR13_002665 [Klebsiella quasipneumoniae]|uniref:hypothetical protein n=1 Tax=Klebsiella quasipneumoniae TaxID=1463165 RepID=UPI0017846A77|nr:hypothetical protein [Klebsiella quasipneumoniae]GKO44785.1 hypothetical protein NUBL21974_21860 [Klebsiella quasipneumoniae]